MNEKGPEKTLKQLRQNAKPKDEYKVVRNNNKKTGTSPTYSPNLEGFDKVLSTHDVINTLFARKVGVLNQDDISDDGGKDNLIMFRICFSEGREKCSELKRFHRKVFA